MFKLFKDKAYIYSVVYTDSKSEIQNTGNYVKGYLKPLTPQDSLYQGAFGKDYSYSTKINSGIIETDILEIDSEKYSVKGIVPFGGIRVKYDKLLLVKI